MVIKFSIIDRYKLDPRSLALFRIGLGLLIIIDVLSFAPYLEFFFTHDGVLPPDAYQYRHWYDGSLLKLSGSPVILIAMLSLQVVMAALLALGWKTRLSTLINFVLLLSLNHRFPAALNGGDSLLGLMLFWSLFLPLDGNFRLKRFRSPNSQTVSGLASIAFSLQIALVYLMTALIKDNQIWISEGTAIYHVLNLQDIVRPFWIGKFNEFNFALKGLSAFTLVGEALIGLAILALPFLHDKLKLALVLAGVLMHLLFFMFLDVGIFPFINMVSFLPFLPAGFWDKLKINKPLTEDRVKTRWSAALYYGQNAMLVICMYAVLAINLTDYIPKSKVPLWSATKPLCDVLDLHQRWGMFSVPATFNVWLNVVGIDEKNQPVNLQLPNLYLSHRHPEKGKKMYKSHRMQLFAENLALPKSFNHKKQFLIWMYKRYEQEQKAPLRSITLLSNVSSNFPLEATHKPIEVDTLYTMAGPELQKMTASK